MENPGYIALSRQLALRRDMDVVANNIANMNTPAFKAERVIFREFIEEPEPKQPLSFVQDFGMARNLTEGPAAATGNPLDLAISGPGYFSVETPEGLRYSRHGRLQLDGQGQLVNSQGSPVLSAGGAPITIPPGGGDVTVAADGTVSANNGTIAKIGLSEFEDQTGLKRDANGLYDANDQPAQAATKSRVMQGMLEQSNVQPIIEMTRMIDIHRSYQAAQKLVTSEHEQAMRAINKLARARQS
ncbi:MAG: flagellar basal-body rod protein FlgF [Alphaproteobacteria bacterium]|nr:flagellar basal-body rod protein FlgF [Alphaproteobacteria bacterium]